MTRTLVIDNYDSFTYNLVHFLGELGADMEIVRNDKITVEGIHEMSPERIVISPGPCTPNEAGISLDVIREFGSSTPLLGVCLGHQSIGQSFGGNVIRAEKVMHMVQDIRGGRDNDPGFFTRMKGQGIWPQLIRQRVRRAARKYGMDRRFPPLRCDLFRPPERDGQMELF